MEAGEGGGMRVCDDEYGTHWLFRALACLLSTLTASQTSSQSAIWLGDRTILPLSPDFFIIHLGGAGEHNYCHYRCHKLAATKFVTLTHQKL